MPVSITGEQCRTGRELLNWTREDLGSKAGINPVTIRVFEAGGATRESQRNRIRSAMESAGIRLMTEHGEAIAKLRRLRPAPPAIN